MSAYFASLTVENNKNKKFVKFLGDMLNFYDFIQVFVFTTNLHLNVGRSKFYEPEKSDKVSHNLLVFDIHGLISHLFL